MALLDRYSCDERSSMTALAFRDVHDNVFHGMHKGYSIDRRISIVKYEPLIWQYGAALND